MDKQFSLNVSYSVILLCQDDLAPTPFHLQLVLPGFCWPSQITLLLPVLLIQWLYPNVNTLRLT